MNQFTNDYKLIASLKLLEKIGAEEIFQNLAENTVKIEFYDLSLMAYSYRNHYAISGINNLGERFILINTRYYKCSIEEIACLIAHESCHKSDIATLAEETIATETEAKYWLKLKQPKKVYKKTNLLERLDELAELYKDSTDDNNKIKEQIADSEFYKKQLALE